MAKQNDRMDPGVMQVALLNEVAERLLTLQTFLQPPEGIIEPYEVANITTQKRTIKPDKKWFSVQILNDGPGDLSVLINPTQNHLPHRMLFGEPYAVDMRNGLITEIQLSSSTTTAARVIGVR